MLYKKKTPLFIFLIPGFIMMIVFLYYPFVQNIFNSLYDMTNIVKMPGTEWKYIGMKNFQYLFKDSTIRIALLNSVYMMGLTIVFQVGIAFVLAVLVNSIKKGQQFFRTVYFFPVVIASTALGLMFRLFYQYENGALNQILTAMGKEKFDWLGASTAFVMIVIPTIWSYVGFYFVIMLTGMADISEDVYEAAAIDGCSKFKAVFSITIPLLRGVICTCITLAVTGALKVFDLPWVIAPNGAPQNLAHFLGTYMYQVTFVKRNYDYGSTIALVIVILGVIVAQITERVLKPDANL